MLPKVIVTDSSERAALAVIRSLGKRGIDIVAADSIRFNAGFLSKYCSRRFIYPSPLKDKIKFVESLLRFVKSENFDLLIPITDLTMIPILERRDEFEDYVRVAAPLYKTAIKALDKARTIKIAEECGVPYPKTFLIEGGVKTLKDVASRLQYPVVIKPRMKVLWKKEQAVMLKVTPRNYAYNSKDLMDKYTKIISQFNKFDISHDFFLIQEFAEGEGYGVELLMHNLEPKAVFMHKRLREYPITGGASTLRMSVWNEKLANYAIILLRKMNWQGVAMVEFKVNSQNEDVKLMEVNGRFWGALQLALNAGVDFPYLLYRVMMEEDVVPCYNYKVGVMQRWLLPGDLLWLYCSLKNGKKSKLQCLVDFLQSSYIPDDIISLNDFSPTFGAILNALHDFSEVVRGDRTIYGEVVV